MLSPNEKRETLRSLQREILSLQGLVKTSGVTAIDSGLGPLENAFPDRTFPTGAVHEFLSYGREDAAATNGFISGLLGRLMLQRGACLWISTKRRIFPPALKYFGIDPDRIIFIDLTKDKDALWVVEEALKCEALAAVVGEFRELDFTQSRRLQLAVEQSRVTGFMHRYSPKAENTVACITRWKIQPLASIPEDGMPGIGLPQWNVQLLKIRNGKPGVWQLKWERGGFKPVRVLMPVIREIAVSKTGTYE